MSELHRLALPFARYLLAYYGRPVVELSPAEIAAGLSALMAAGVRPD